MKKILLVLAVFLFSTCFCGCVFEHEVPPQPYIYSDFFYKKKINDVLVDNKVTIGLGTVSFSSTLYDIYFTNISIAVYIDEASDPINKMTIAKDEFFCDDYYLDMAHINTSKIKLTDYKKTFSYDLGDYEINNVIKFDVAYDNPIENTIDGNREVHFKTVSHELVLYGGFTNNKFIIKNAQELRR